MPFIFLLSAHHRTFGKVFRKGLHVVRSVLSRAVGTQVSSHRLHLLLQSQLGVLLGSLVEASREMKVRKTMHFQKVETCIRTPTL